MIVFNKIMNNWRINYDYENMNRKVIFKIM